VRSWEDAPATVKPQKSIMYVIQTNRVNRVICQLLNSSLYRTISRRSFSDHVDVSCLAPPPSTGFFRFMLLSALESSRCSASNCSSVSRLSWRLKRAMYCRTSTALASWPRYSRNLGLSWKRKTRARAKKTASVMAPSVKRR
jgi:hypothetical protein